MSDDKPKSLDIFGIHPLATTVEKATSAMIDGTAAILSRICLPAAEEYGRMLQDRVQQWRVVNLAKLAVKTEQKLQALNAAKEVHAHPRIVSKIIHEGSMNDDDGIQDMWSGLLASACSADGQDDSNLMYVQLLSSLSRLQARLLSYACENTKPGFAPNGLLNPGYVSVTIEQLRAVTGETDLLRLDREMDYLRSLELISGGFSLFHPTDNATVSPTVLALGLYVRCKGYRGSVADFFLLNSSAPI